VVCVRVCMRAARYACYPLGTPVIHYLHLLPTRYTCYPLGAPVIHYSGKGFLHQMGGVGRGGVGRGYLPVGLGGFVKGQMKIDQSSEGEELPHGLHHGFFV
jgi:hypothetical protein